MNSQHSRLFWMHTDTFPLVYFVDNHLTKWCFPASKKQACYFHFAVCSVQSSALLEKEKDELQGSLEDALQKLQEQHQKDLVHLEERLQAFYQAEWDKVHQSYQEEADKCKFLMQQQVCHMAVLLCILLHVFSYWGLYIFGIVKAVCF